MFTPSMHYFELIRQKVFQCMSDIHLYVTLIAYRDVVNFVACYEGTCIFGAKYMF